jgi:signal transduction histidine kinase
MPTIADILASGIHDVRNRLFDAIELLSTHATPELLQATEAVQLASDRLNRTLVAYDLYRHHLKLAFQRVSVAELLTDTVLSAHTSPEHQHIEVDIDVADDLFWVLDRDLITDSLTNALQNSLRFAKTRVRLSARQAKDWLILLIEDDGPGFTAESGERTSVDGRFRGLGLLISGKIARLHRFDGRSGKQIVKSGGALGGAAFTIRLPGHQHHKA